MACPCFTIATEWRTNRHTGRSAAKYRFIPIFLEHFADSKVAWALRCFDDVCGR